MQEANYILRRATAEDLPAIRQIFAEARKFMADYGNPQWNGGYPYEDVILDKLAADEFRILQCGGEVAAIYSVCGSEPDYDDIEGEWLTKGENYLAVHTLAVSPAFRGRGLARAAFKEAEAEALLLKKGSIRGDTHVTNAPMRALIAACGFKECGALKVRQGFVCFEKTLQNHTN